jgi:hypothetical protein
MVERSSFAGCPWPHISNPAWRPADSVRPSCGQCCTVEPVTNLRLYTIGTGAGQPAADLSQTDGARHPSAACHNSPCMPGWQPTGGLYDAPAVPSHANQARAHHPDARVMSTAVLALSPGSHTITRARPFVRHPPTIHPCALQGTFQCQKSPPSRCDWRALWQHQGVSFIEYHISRICGMASKHNQKPQVVAQPHDSPALQIRIARQTGWRPKPHHAPMFTQ